MAQSFTTNVGLSALPEYDQSKDPAAYAEFLRLRNAIQVLQGAIDGLGGAGGAVVTHAGGNLQQGRVIVAANNAGDITNIADGTAVSNYVLSWVAAGTPPIWKAPSVGSGGPIFRAGASAASTISPNDTPCKIALGTISFDPSGYWSVSLQRWIPQVAGYYQVNFAVFTGANAGYFVALLFKNGVNISFGSLANVPSVPTFESTGSDLVFMNGTTDYIELFAQSGAATLITGTNAISTFLSAVWVHT